MSAPEYSSDWRPDWSKYWSWSQTVLPWDQKGMQQLQKSETLDQELGPQDDFVIVKKKKKYC